MSQNDAAVKTFLAAADDVLGEYEQGYMDADAALSQLEMHVEQLREKADW